MTYGSPSSLDDVPRYIRAVRGGREVAAEVIDEFRRRYEMIGGSPLIGITRAQAEALERRLDGQALVRAGMRFSSPTIADALAELADGGVGQAVAIVMSPQFSALLMGGYGRALDEAARQLRERAPEVRLAGAWYREQAFIDALAGRIREGLGRFAPEERDNVAVLLTGHSLPRRVAEQEPDYLGQLTETATTVVNRAALTDDRWAFCWQSAG
ncbi:MAG: ferrochelatase, partial [Chloroflexota bacterium]|nr:ferrochelatase [Chloroflexota bacterium]